MANTSIQKVTLYVKISAAAKARLRSAAKADERSVPSYMERLLLALPVRPK